jgi:hypothetical protein
MRDRAQEAQCSPLTAAINTRLISSAMGINPGGFFSEGALVLFSILMLRSGVFSRGMAILGIAGHGLDFIRFAMSLILIPENASAILLMIGGLPQLILLILVGVKLIRIGKDKNQIQELLKIE